MIRLIGFLLIICFGCVSQKKYDDLWGKKALLEVEQAKCADELTEAKGALEQLHGQLETLNEDHSELRTRLDATGQRPA